MSIMPSSPPVPRAKAMPKQRPAVPRRFLWAFALGGVAAVVLTFVVLKASLSSRNGGGEQPQPEPPAIVAIGGGAVASLAETAENQRRANEAATVPEEAQPQRQLAELLPAPQIEKAVSLPAEVASLALKGEARALLSQRQEARDWIGELKPKGPAVGYVVAVTRGPGKFKHRDRSTEEELRQALAAVPEVGLGNTGPAVLRAYYNGYKKNAQVYGNEGPTDPTPLLMTNPMARCLPLYYGPGSKLDSKAAKTLGELARKLHQYLDNVAPMDESGNRPRMARLRDTMLGEMRGQKPEWLRVEAVPSLLQLLMPEEKSVRLLLVELLAEIPERPATVALAQRAVFDIDADVRQAAIDVLKKRSPNDFRSVLLKALQYPWAPPADHAAEALVELEDRGSVPHLVTLLDKPDPTAPWQAGKSQMYVREVVKAQHLSNCMLCHPPSATLKEPVLMEDPVVRLPVSMVDPITRKYLDATQGQLSIIPACSEGGGGMMGKGSSSSSRLGLKFSGTLPLGIRGDVTYLRQDFSVRQPISQPQALQGPLAAPVQRYDYLVRTRPLTKKEIAQLKEQPEDKGDYPQREAVLFALRELTGKDVGKTSEAWRELFPREVQDVEAARLASELRKAQPPQQLQLIAKWKEAKEPVYARALADAIPGLRGPVKDKAREALGERLSREPDAALRELLRDEDVEMRQAAAAVCAKRTDRTLVPDLIALAEDPEPGVAHAAGESLRGLTGKDFDTPTGWRDWWQAENKK
jgi:HEAT repeat protein